MHVFRDRYEAGRLLATKLLPYANLPEVIVLGLPRGGVPVAFEVARSLNAPLDVYMVRKLGLPGHKELAMGAVASGGVIVVNREVVDAVHVPDETIERVAAEESEEIARRERIYRDGHPPTDLTGRVVVLVDDGVATGSTMFAAVSALRGQGPAGVVVATPVVAAQTLPTLQEVADDVVYVDAPENFGAVGQFYVEFSPTTDDEVRALLVGYGASPLLAGYGEPAKPRREATTRAVSISADGVTLSGDLAVPSEALGLVVFAHGAGSSRHSPRNQFVAEVLRGGGFATLLIDLLTEREEESDRVTAQLRFDIQLLARRLIAVTDWLPSVPSTRDLPVAYFGASTGAASALVAAAERPQQIRALVSRGGRPDLAERALPRVRAPTLLIVGEKDPLVLGLNRQAFRQLKTVKRLEIVPKASHLFEEPGALERVAELAVEWFEDHLVAAEVTEGTGRASVTRDEHPPDASH